MFVCVAGRQLCRRGARWADAHRYRLPRRQTCCGERWGLRPEKREACSPRPHHLLSELSDSRSAKGAGTAMVGARSGSEDDVPHFPGAMLAAECVPSRWAVDAVRRGFAGQACLQSRRILWSSAGVGEGKVGRLQITHQVDYVCRTMVGLGESPAHVARFRHAQNCSVLGAQSTNKDICRTIAVGFQSQVIR